MNIKFLNNWRALFGCAVIMLAMVFTARAQPAVAQTEQAPDEQEKLVHYSLYYEDFKNANYESSLPNLQWILQNDPAYHGPGRKSDVNFERAVVLYDSLASKAESDEAARAWLDSALVIFDTVVPTLQELDVEVDEYKWTMAKGRFIQTHADQLPDLQEQLIPIYEKAYGLAPDRIQPYYIYMIIQDYAAKDKEKALEFMDEVEQRFQDNQEVVDYIAQVRNTLFTSPEERMSFLEDQHAKDPNNLEIVRELFEIYEELGEREKMYEIGEKLSTMEPSAATYRILASLRLGDGQPQAAFDLIQKALELPDAEPRAEDYYNMGVAQQQMGSLTKARTYFRQALDINPNYGLAYIAIGDLYVTAVSECSSSYEREDRAVYWLAVDYYNKAKQVDPSVANTANNKIRSYSRAFPDEEAKFFKNWKNGDPYMVNYGCYSWINEQTTVK